MRRPLQPNDSGRRRGRRGSAQVEGAIAMLPLLALMCATVDIGVAILVKNTMQLAVRQGVRYAVTSQTISGMGQDDSIRTVVKKYSMGFLDYLSPNQDPMQRITVTYYDPLTLAEVKGVGSNA